MILNEMDPLDTSQDSMMSGSGSAELVLTQSGLTTDTDAAPVLYAVQYWYYLLKVFVEQIMKTTYVMTLNEELRIAFKFTF